MTRGWRYFCDEIALVDRHSLAQHPFPKALCIKAGSYRLLRSLGVRFARRRDYVKQFKGRVGYVNPLDLGSDAVAEPAPVRCVIFLTYAGGTTPRLCPISRAEAAMNLFRGCFNPHVIGDTLPIIQTLVNRATCFRLEVGGPQATGQLLEAAVDGSPPKGATQTSAQLPTAIGPRSNGKETPSFTNRREMLHLGAKLIYVPPLVLTVFAQQARAANYSCYPLLHTCKPPGQGAEDCCPGLHCTEIGLDSRCR